MKNQFANYETATMLKKLGFDEICIASFILSEPYLFEDISHELKGNKHRNSEGITTAPLWMQIKQWLWNKHGKNLFVTIEANHEGQFQYFVWDDAKNLGLHDDDIYFTSPVTAEIKGIEEAVNYLHKRMLAASAVTPINTKPNDC